MVTLVTTELAPEVQMRPPEVIKVSKRDFNWPFKLSHVLQDGNLRTKFPMPSRLKDCPLMTLRKEKDARGSIRIPCAMGSIRKALYDVRQFG